MAMKDSYKTAGKLYLDRMEKQKPDDFRKFRRLAKQECIVVSGQFDRAQEVLTALSVRHRLVSGQQLASTTLPLDRAVIINCAGELGRSHIDQLRTHVESGGTLVTTDWALDRVVQRAFPGFVEYNGRSTIDDVVTVELTPEGNAILRDTVGANDQPRWWLEGSSYPIRVLDKDKVEVLIRSDEMLDRYGEEAIVVRFRFGKGWVYHMVSHIYLQRAEELNARQRQGAGEFVQAKGASLAELDIKDDQTVGEMEAAYLSIGLLIHILREAAKEQPAK